MTSNSLAHKPTVCVLDPMHEEGLRLLKTWADLIYDPHRTGTRESRAKSHGLIVRGPISEHDLDAFPLLCAVVRSGSGVDGIPMGYTKKRAITVANTPGANADAVAEYVFAALLLIARQLPNYDAALRNGRWHDRALARDKSFELKARRIGILGMGEIGQRVARIAHAGFGATVQATITSPRPLPLFIKPVDLATLFESSDCVVVCCSLTQATQGLVGMEELASLKPGSVLINVGRGAVINEKALLAYATSPARQTTLVLDVFHQSPLPQDHGLNTATACLLTPHLAGLSTQAEIRMAMACATAIRRLLDTSRTNQH